ncbi:hypothetical protein NHQ30_004043 [Ciborinia camelliae]|nr:hypothetical protein NHQ30_004043 [Ciborinia camelliae]
MAVLSVPTLDPVKIEMLDRYLNIMCEQRNQLEASTVSAIEVPEPEQDHEETWSSILDVEENYLKTPIIPTEFTRFSELPGKVRRLIWHFARPEARYIKIRESRWGETLYSRAPIPAMLHTCQESRKVALKWYDLSFARDPSMGFWDRATLKRLTEEALTRPSKPTIYFDWERDGVYSQCTRCNGNKMSCRHSPLSFDFLRVKRVAFEGPLSVKPFYKISLCFRAVESIILIRGRSAIRRRAVSPSEFIPVDKKFEWEGEDLLETCLEAIRNKAPGSEAIKGIKSVQRMTLMDINPTEVVDRTGRSTWPCR